MQDSTEAHVRDARQRPASGMLTRLGIHRFSAVELLVVLILWLISGPFVMQLQRGDVIEAVLMTVLMLSAVRVVGGRRRMLIVGCVLAAPAVIGKWGNHVRPDLVPPQIFAISALVFIGFVVVQLLRFIFRAPRVNTEVLCVGICGYLFIGIFWASAYVLVGQLVPGSFAFSGDSSSDHQMIGVEAVYFSFVTLCTVGYGDIVPTSYVSRALAIFEATAGTFYVTVLIARLVALHATETLRKHTDG